MIPVFLNKLARQILAVARAQGAALPEFAAPAPEETAEPTPAPAANGGEERVEPVLTGTDEGPELREPLSAIPEPPPEEKPSAEAGEEKQGSLSRILSTRRAGWRGGKSRRESLSERLKNVRAEASDL